MNDLRKAAEMALERLESHDYWADEEAIQALRQALNETPPCKTHSDAPHGFDRNASHSADRYVCECEGWEPVDNVNMSEERVRKSDKSIHGPTAWMLHGELFWPSEYEVISEAGDNAIPLYTAPPKREWVGLTDDEVIECFDNVAFGQVEDDLIINKHVNIFRAIHGIEAKLKEKNNG